MEIKKLDTYVILAKLWNKLGTYEQLLVTDYVTRIYKDRRLWKSEIN